jgi:hypothetical protein
MADTGDSWVRKFRSVVVMMKDGTTITGKLNIGEFGRISDFFRRSQDQFFVLSDAGHKGACGKVVIINKSEILWAEPEDKECD